jgi:phospholipase C
MLAVALLACDPAPPRTASIDSVAAAPCSQMHRDLSRWLGREIDECGPDVTGLVELTALGSHALLARRRFGVSNSFLRLGSGAAGAANSETIEVGQVFGERTAGFTLLPMRAPDLPAKMLVYDPGSAQWNLYDPQSAPTAQTALLGGEPGDWPEGKPAGHQFLGLEDGHVLDRVQGDGSLRVWRFLETAGKSKLENPAVEMVGGPPENFRRGHRLAPLGRQRLLEWLPLPCSSGGSGAPAADASCPATTFNVWHYTLDAGGGQPDTIDPQPLASGVWPQLGTGQDIVTDEDQLYVWTRASGELRWYRLDPGVPDPLDASLLVGSLQSDKLRSQDWVPPTEAPPIKHVVIILQYGRSFDAYFGRYCQGPASPDGHALACDEGPACCEAMPESTPGAASCSPLNTPAADAHLPVQTPACMSTKMNGGAMDRFAELPPEGCGAAGDFACAGPDAAAGPVAIYHGLARAGALADRFFQSYAFIDGDAAAPALPPDVQNLLYLVSARFTATEHLFSTPVLTKELARLEIPWAIYAGRDVSSQIVGYGVPIFHDPDWFPYRSLEGLEFEHDLATAQLTAVSVVLPDSADGQRSEAPGHPLAAGGVDFVKGLVDRIAQSPYRDDTLVLVTYLTAGGYYDHVPPPPPPDVSIDASNVAASSTPAPASPGAPDPQTLHTIAYGPRVPLLALGRFAQANHISHATLEMSSIAVFIEWNWLHGHGLRGQMLTDDLRRYRDTVASNLGSLLNAETLVKVPDAHE